MSILDVDSAYLIRLLFGEQGLTSLNKVRTNTKTGKQRIERATLRTIYELSGTDTQANMAGLPRNYHGEECYICGLAIDETLPIMEYSVKDGLSCEIEHTLPFITAMLLFGIHIHEDQLNRHTWLIKNSVPKDMMSNEYRLSHKTCNQEKSHIICITWSNQQFMRNDHNLTKILHNIWHTTSIFSNEFKHRLHAAYASYDEFVDARTAENSLYLQPFDNICRYLNWNTSVQSPIGLHILYGAALLKEGPMKEAARQLLVTPAQREHESDNAKHNTYCAFTRTVEYIDREIYNTIRDEAMHKGIQNILSYTTFQTLRVSGKNNLSIDINMYATVEYKKKMTNRQLYDALTNTDTLPIIMAADIVNYIKLQIYSHIMDHTLYEIRNPPPKKWQGNSIQTFYYIIRDVLYKKIDALLSMDKRDKIEGILSEYEAASVLHMIRNHTYHVNHVNHMNRTHHHTNRTHHKYGKYHKNRKNALKKVY